MVLEGYSWKGGVGSCVIVLWEEAGVLRLGRDPVYF